MFGAAGAAIISGIVLVSCFGSVNGSIMTGPRVFFAMSDRGLLFPLVARVSPRRFKTPSVAIWLTAALAVTYVLQNSFAQLTERFILGTWPFYALAVGGVFILRRTRPELARPYRTFGYPITPALFLLGIDRDDGQRDGDQPGGQCSDLRDHPGGDSGVLGVAVVEWTIEERREKREREKEKREREDGDLMGALSTSPLQWGMPHVTRRSSCRSACGAIAR